MSAYYFISIGQRSTGNHTVHKEGCPLMPANHKMICLGKFESPHDALNLGKKLFERSEICSFCCRKCPVQWHSVNSLQMGMKEDFITSGQIVKIRKIALLCPLN